MLQHQSNSTEREINVIKVFGLYLILGIMYLMNGSTTSLILYVGLGVWAFFEPMVIFALIGASNYLPAIHGISPLLIAIVLIVIIVVFSSRKFKIAMTLDKTKIALILMSLWSFITGLTQGNLSFFSTIITFLIFYIVLNLFVDKFGIDDRMIGYFIVGLGFGIVLTFCIQSGVAGFKSNHPFRLAIGERADPNSSGLLFAIFCVYFFIKILDSFNVSLKKTAYYILIFMLGIWVLLLTQSRGSLLCLFVTIFIYLLVAKKITFTRRGVATFIIIGVVICVAAVLAGDYFFSFLTESINKFVMRLNNSESSDGERIYLLTKSFESFFDNPVFGTSLEKFEAFAGHIPHNTFSDYMVTNGLFGIVFFVFMFAIPIISRFPVKKATNNSLPYWCYFVCFINILFYSASNEKITLLLLYVLLHSNIANKLKFKKRGAN